MTTPPSDPDGTTPVDRRWFEAALRSQGFVVEPPADDLAEPTDEQPDAPPPVPVDPPAHASPDTPPTTGEPQTPATAPSAERPPMPSALLARIAARGRPAVAAEPDAGAEPDARAEPVTRSGIATAPPAEVDRRPPWASAVDAPVAPWSSPTEPMTMPMPAEPETPIGPADPIQTSADQIQPVEPRPPSSTETVGIAEPADGDVLPEVPESKTEPPTVGGGVPVAAPSAALASPYAPAAALDATAVVQPGPATVSAAPGSSEGELWALVGASEPAAAPAPASEATRVILTIITAFLILVIVVGSLVLASQIA